MPGSSASNAPDLSIVIVNWNTLQMTRECLQSVFDALARPAVRGISAQVILVDNASTGSADMVAAVSRRSI